MAAVLESIKGLHRVHGNIRVATIKFTWETDGEGDATTGVLDVGVVGKVSRLTGIVSGVGDNTADAYLFDERGCDCLCGCGVNLKDNQTNEQSVKIDAQGSHVAINAEQITFTVAQAGANKTGVAYIYIEDAEIEDKRANP